MPGDRLPTKTVRFDLKIPPETKAKIAIGQLSSDPRFRTKCMIPGPTPPEMLEENKRIDERRRQEEHKIIAQYGVFDAYLEPLRAKEARLQAELDDVRRDIAGIEALRPESTEDKESP